MIYLDTSVVLAQLLGEDRRPPPELWERITFSSRLLEYETWVRIHARRLTQSHGDATRVLLSRVSFLELSRTVIARASEPFPVPVRTLDALHLASIEFLRAGGLMLELASYDDRMLGAAKRLSIPIADLALS